MRRRFVYGSAKFALLIMGLLPDPIAVALARALGLSLYHVMRKKRLAGTNNLRSVLGDEIGDREISLLVRSYFQKIILAIVEFAKISRLDRGGIEKRVRVEGLNRYRDARRDGRGVMVVSAHFGSIALMMHAGALLVEPYSFVVTRKNVLTEMLCKSGNITIPKGGAMKVLEKTLNDGGAVGVVIDQVARHESHMVEVDFFGRKIKLNKGPALLAMRSGASVISSYIFRDGDNKQRIVVGEEIPIQNSGDEAEDVRVNMNRFAKTLEDAVRQAPDHWMYLAWMGNM
jgi:Kdo2-lipid IVA lauroyltransferase/acyltransferase